MDPKEPEQSILLDSSELLSNYEKGWVYPTRPLLLNQRYAYNLLKDSPAVNPKYFWIEIDDESTASVRANVTRECELVKKELIKTSFWPIRADCLVDMLPVVVKNKKNDLYYRAEINCVKLEEKSVNVTLVDSGEEFWVSTEEIFPPSKELFRYPKLAMPCKMAQLVPIGNSTGWKEAKYASYFEGKKTSFVTISSVERGINNVNLECDNIDVGYDLVMNKNLADFIPLEKYDGEVVAGPFRCRDFSRWIGQKIPVFGTHCSVVDGRATVHLQLDPTLANTIWDTIDGLGPREISDSEFDKEIGSAVLVEYEEVCYRSKLKEKTLNGYLVQLVDIGDCVEVDEKKLFKLPEELAKFPEASTACLIPELIGTLITDEMLKKLSELVVDQNLYGVIVGSLLDSSSDGLTPKCLVSLSQSPNNPPPGELDQVSFAKIFQVDPVSQIHSFNHEQCYISQSLAPILLCAESDYFPGVKYDGILAFAENHNSVWLQLEGDDVRAEMLTEEMTEYYNNWSACPKTESSLAVVGTYVAAQQSEDEKWYRAKIIAIYPSHSAYKVTFLDYGNDDVIEINKIKPLINYFGQFKAFALQVALPVDPLPEANDEIVYNYIIEFTQYQELSVRLYNSTIFNYAWISCNETSLAHNMEKDGIAKLKFEQTKPTN